MAINSHTVLMKQIPKGVGVKLGRSLQAEQPSVHVVPDRARQLTGGVQTAPGRVVGGLARVRPLPRMVASESPRDLRWTQRHLSSDLLLNNLNLNHNHNHHLDHTTAITTRSTG